MKAGQDISGIDSDQELAALSRTLSGGSVLGDAQRDGVDAIALEQTVLKWGDEDGPSSLNTAYKEFLDATSTALERNTTKIFNMIEMSRASVADYEATEEDIVNMLRKLMLPSAGTARAVAVARIQGAPVQGAPTAAAGAVPPVPGSAGDDGGASAAGGGFDARDSGAP